MTARTPICRLVLDLGGVPWAGDPETAERLLLGRPGVQKVTVSPGSRRAVVLHDARLSLPELWNWLVDCGAHCAGGAVPSHECTAPQAGTQDATST